MGPEGGRGEDWQGCPKRERGSEGGGIRLQARSSHAGLPRGSHISWIEGQTWSPVRNTCVNLKWIDSNQALSGIQ